MVKEELLVRKSKAQCGEIICETLQKCGIDTVFGLPGTQNIDFFDSLRVSGIRTILTTNETAASFMANGYYRASGKPALVVSIPGPGFAFAMPGIAEAREDSVALIHLVVSAEETPGKSYKLQDIDIKSICSPVVKLYTKVENANDTYSSVIKSFTTAVSGEPGPVVIEVDRKIIKAVAEYPSPRRLKLDVYSEPDADRIDKLADLVAKSGPMMFLVGQGAFEAARYLKLLAEHLNAPIVPTCSGRGILPDDHPLMIDADYSIAGIDIINEMASKSDLTIAVGCKFSHNGTCGFKLELPRDRLVHVDASSEVLATGNYHNRLAIQADSKASLKALWNRRNVFSSKSTGFNIDDIAVLKKRASRARREAVQYEPSLEHLKGMGLKDLFQSINRRLTGRSIIVTDTGLHQTIVRAYCFVNRPRGLIVPSDFQSMGYGISSAIGAKVADPNADVIAFTGDGSLMLTGMELTTALREGIDLSIVLFRDGSLGSIRHQQIERYGQEVATELRNPDYAQYARSLGVHYFELKDPVEPVIEGFFSSRGVKILDVPLLDSPELETLREKSLRREKLSQLPLTGVARKINKWIKRK